MRAIVLGLALAAPSAAASELDPHIELDLGLFAGPDGEVAVAPNLGAYTRLSSDLALSGRFGFATLDQSGSDFVVRPLNPFLALHLTPEMERVRMRVGVGAALPLAGVEDDQSRAAYRTARGIRGSWDPWLYRWDTFSLAVPLRIEFDVAPALQLAADGAVFLHIGTRPGAGEQLGVQGAVEARARLGAIDLGVRAQIVRPEEDRTQAALEPFAALHLGPVDIGARLTMNLAPPDGFAFDRDGIWGAHLSLGYRF